MQAMLCRFIKRHLTFLRKWFLNKTCKKLRLSRKAGVSYPELLEQVESAIFKSQSELATLKSEYVDMGGANNLGMLLHRSPLSKQPFYTTKLESCILAQRELHFLNWQKKQLSRVDFIAPNLVSYEHAGDLGVCALSMEYLSIPNAYEPNEVVKLYHKLGALPAETLKSSSNRPESDLFYLGLEPKTKITRTLCFIVTKVHTNEGYLKALRFLEIRRDAFNDRPREFQRIYRFVESCSRLANDFEIDKYYGLVHGDFKKSNILSDEHGQLKVIDLQYYCYGARLWDLAFFCSKEKWFSEAFNRFVRPLELDNDELHLFVMFYILAALLHVKKSNVNKKLKMQVLPAIHHIVNEKVAQ